jgi:molybdopterin synthase catalytic subunit
MLIPLKISVQVESFDVGLEQSQLIEGRNNVGAVVAFTGLCRSENGALKALELEHYPQMAERQLRQLAQDAASRWDLLGITIIHRVGIIHVGEEIVLVIVASSHRKASFEAAEFIMDALKSTAPFWKKEHYVDGAKDKWVEAKLSDDVALERWDKNKL